MTVANHFRRVELRALLGQEDATFGNWHPTVNISAALPNSRGGPIDWWVRGDTPGLISNAIRKGGSPNLFTVSVLTNAANNLGSLNAWSNEGQITWTDGPPGKVTGSTFNAHSLGDRDEGVGEGFRITVANASQWPDWRMLKMWAFDWPERFNHYKAYLNNPGADTDELWIDRDHNGPLGLAGGSDYVNWSQTKLITQEVIFAADGPGQTLNYEWTRTGTYWPSLYAVALYIPKSTQALRARGFQQVVTMATNPRPQGV